MAGEVGRRSLSLVLLACLSVASLFPAESADTHLGQGYDALKQDRYEVAVSEFRAALRLDPTLTMRARFPLAVALFEMKQPTEARQEFERVRREAGDQPSISYYLGRLDLSEEKYTDAVRHLTQAIAKPPFPDTAYYLGLACAKVGDLTAAEKWLRQAAESNPRDTLARYQLGMVYRKLGREADAKKALAESAELRRRNTNESELRTECAQKLDSGPRAEARALCQQLYNPNDAERLTALGTIYGQHGDLDDALEPLRRAAELAPERPEMQYNLAYTYFRLGRFQDARGPISGAVKRWPDIFQLSYLYGAVLAKLGDDTAAYQELSRAHSLNPQDAGATNLLYEATVRLGRKSAAAHQYPDALRYFNEAAKLHPTNAEPHRELAQVYAATGNTGQAAAEENLARQLSAQ